METRRVDFFSVDGHRLVGDYHPPHGNTDPAPGVVLCQGLSGVRNLVLPQVASAFADAGLAALTFDYQGFGDSEGPQGRIDPLSRARDALSAFAWLRGEDEVDSERCGFYGLSLGGGTAPFAAALEPSARAVVAVSGFGSGERFLRSLHTPAQWLHLMHRVEKDRARRSRTGKSERVEIGDIVPFDASFQAAYNALGHGDQSSSLPPKPSEDPEGFELSSIDALLAFDLRPMLPRLAGRPILFVHGERDNVIPLEDARDTFQAAPEPKELIVAYGYDHVGLDSGPGLQWQIGLARDWFLRHL